MSKKNKAGGLGRGLSALMADLPVEKEHHVPQAPGSEVPIEALVANPHQPRRYFDEDKLNDLAESIKSKGILQPLIVRRVASQPDSYEIVAGERRWRAAQIAQLHTVPVIVRDLNDTEVLELAIIENIQRDDLNPIEEAQGYKQLSERFGHTHEQISLALGKSRSQISNLVRLLTLPFPVQALVEIGAISAGHARALVNADDPEKIARIVVDKGLNVRETEALIKKFSEDALAAHDLASVRSAKVPKDTDTLRLEKDLSANIGMKVSIAHKEGKDSGQVTIKYANLDGLDAICRLLSTS